MSKKHTELCFIHSLFDHEVEATHVRHFPTYIDDCENEYSCCALCDQCSPLDKALTPELMSYLIEVSLGV